MSYTIDNQYFNEMRGKESNFILSNMIAIHFCPVKTQQFFRKFELGKLANLISKLNFYKLIPYPMDNC